MEDKYKQNKKSNKKYKKKNMNKDRWEFIFILFGSTFTALVLLFFNIYYIKRLDVPGVMVVYNIIDILALSVFLIPPMLYKYAKYQETKSIEDNFPLFMRNIVEGLRSGMDMNKAILYASHSHYGALDKHIKVLVNQLSWNVPFNKAMRYFAESINNKLITRSISTILEAYRSGGNLAEVLDAVSQSTIEIEKIRKERSSKIHGQMIQGYVIFVIFLLVMIGMEKFLIPALASSGMGSSGLNTHIYSVLFLHLSVIQAIFAGLSIGKMAEGSISAGIRHSIILALIAYSVLTIA